MSHPLVSVIVPTYKRTDYLKLTLQSILNQTFQDFEVLVVDDGTPSGENLLLCQTMDKVRYIKIENSGGPAKPRNVGIREAKGKYLAFVDDDDLWLSNKLEKQVAVLEDNPDFGLVHACCEIIDGNGILQNRIIGRPGSPEVKHGDVALRMMGNWTVMMPTSFIRKEIVDTVGFFNDKMPSAGEDTEFWVRCSFLTKFYYLDKKLAYYRVHSNNISRDKRKYLKLPLYLKYIIREQLLKQRISTKEYSLLLNNLCKMLIRNEEVGLFNKIQNLFFLNPIWMFKSTNFKMLLYVLFIKNKYESRA